MNYKKILLIALFTTGYTQLEGVSKSTDAPLELFTKKLPTIKSDHDDLSAGLITLFIFKNQSNLFKKQNLKRPLKKLIKSIPKHTTIESLFDLQTAVDFWYFTKLLDYKDIYQPKAESINAFINHESIKAVKEPFDALLYWVIITSLLMCDEKTYEPFNKYLSECEKLIGTSGIEYWYYLTHVILYDCQFGKIEPSQNSRDAMTLLEKCAKKISFEKKHYDILAETVICAKLCDKENRTVFKKIEKKLNKIIKFSDFHEQCTILLATNL